MMYQKHWQLFLRHSVLSLKHRTAASPALWYSLRIKLIKTLQVRLIPRLHSGSVFSLLSLRASFAPIITKVSCFYVPLRVSVTFSGSVSTLARTCCPHPIEHSLVLADILSYPNLLRDKGERAGITESAATNT